VYKYVRIGPSEDPALACPSLSRIMFFLRGILSFPPSKVLATCTCPFPASLFGYLSLSLTRPLGPSLPHARRLSLHISPLGPLCLCVSLAPLPPSPPNWSCQPHPATYPCSSLHAQLFCRFCWPPPLTEFFDPLISVRPTNRSRAYLIPGALTHILNKP
jgi:hypothetical protein